MTQAAPRWAPAFAVLLAAGTLAWYGSVLARYVINAGQGDDFVDVLWFLEIFLSRDTLAAQLDALLLPNHEHITLFNHLVYLAHYAVTGQVNFVHYVLVGHLIAVASALVLADWLRPRWGWTVAIGIAVPLYLNLYYWHASFWPITALSNQAVVLFALLAARSQARNPQAVLAPLGWALLAVTTQFNGLLVLPSLCVASVLAHGRGGTLVQRQQWLVWGAAAVISCAAYLAHESPFEPEHLRRQIAYTEPEQAAAFAAHQPDQPLHEQLRPAQAMQHAARSALAVTGATVFREDEVIPAMLVGALLLAFAWHTRRQWWADPFARVVLTFAVGSMALIVIGRGLVLGPELVMYWRYRLYSFLVLLVLLGCAANRWPRPRALAVLLLLGLAVQVASVRVLPAIADNRERVHDSYYSWLVDGGMGRTRMTFYPHNQDWRLFHAQERGYYHPVAAIALQHRPAAWDTLAPAACPGTTVAAEARLTAWSKKARALATEVKTGVDGLAAGSTGQLWFCHEAAAYRAVLGPAQVDAGQGRHWPLLILKNELPPSEYRAYWRPDGQAESVSLGLVRIP